MSRFLCCVLSLVFCSAVFSQRLYFIYLQSEEQQPFFVKMNEKTYSSAPSGYLILSYLKDSSYYFKVGFPQNKWQEQPFSVDIKSKDRGFLLKNFGEKGWGLFDLQTMGVQMSAENSEKDKAIKTELKAVSAFTEVLSKAANDPSLKEKPVFAVMKKEEKTVNVQPAVIKEEKTTLMEQPGVDPVSPPKPMAKKEEPPVIVKEEVQNKDIAPAIAKEEVIAQKSETKTVSAQDYKKSVVVKKSESSTTQGFGLTFVDEYGDGRKDTIQIIIPNSKSLYVEANEKPASEKKFLDITDEPKEDKLPDAKGVVKNNCSSFASENDFLKLRKKMAGQKTEESMINEATKGFKAKCYTVEQVKNLGNLFLNEAGKFQFYEAAYSYTKDINNFTILEGEFKDAYFLHRFKNLIK